MWDYPGPQPRRGNRGGFKKVALLAVAALAVVLVAGWLWQSHATATPQDQASSVATQSAVTAGGQLWEGACIDPTTSTATSFAVGVRRDLADAVAGLAPAGRVPTQITGNRALSRPQPAIGLWIRQVDTNSLSTLPTPYTISVRVPGVLGLAAHRPAPGEARYTSRMTTWTAEYDRVSESRTAARRAAGRAAQSIRGLPLDNTPKNRSAISACVSGLLLTVPRTGRRTYLIASDLQENRAPQLEGSFNGSPLVIVQACDSGKASYCDGLLRRFKTEMHRLHVGPMTVVRPENAAQAIGEWVRGKAVTP